MKSPISILLRFAAVLGLVICAFAPGTVSALTPGRITVARDGSQLTLSWDCVAGRSYRLYSTTDFGGAWEEVATEPEPLVPTGSRLSYVVSMAPETRFYRVAELTEIAPAGMVLIPVGSFMMGDSFGEGQDRELPVHNVYVSAFYMDQYPVTKALWDEVHTWALANGYGFDNAGSGKAHDHPVQTVNWYDAVKWCNARSEKEGRVPAYYTDGGQKSVYRTGQVDVQNDWVNWDGGYRLPTEAEWEKAARGGAEGRRYPWLDADTITHSRANYRSSSDYAYDSSPTRDFHPDFQVGGMPYTSPAGSFEPNGYALYDMAGNVWGWCWDWWFESYYSVSPASDPRGPGSGSFRVMRGGGWNYSAVTCRVSLRSYGWPDFRHYSYGFRSVLPSDQS
jgi:formylglycine-generating enzyme required for sulfatase activity